MGSATSDGRRVTMDFFRGRHGFTCCAYRAWVTGPNVQGSQGLHIPFTGSLQVLLRGITALRALEQMLTAPDELPWVFAQLPWGSRDKGPLPWKILSSGTRRLNCRYQPWMLRVLADPTIICLPLRVRYQQTSCRCYVITCTCCSSSLAVGRSDAAGGSWINMGQAGHGYHRHYGWFR